MQFSHHNDDDDDDDETISVTQNEVNELVGE